MFVRKPLWLMTDGAGAAGADDSGAGSGAAGAGGSGGTGAAGAEGGAAGDGGKADDEGKTFTQAELDRIIAGRLSKYADYDDVKRQLADVQAANQTESEKAINAAKDEGRKEALAESGKAIALEVFNGAAGRRNDEYDVAPALALIDLGKFVKDDGSVDRDAIKAAVDQIVPEKGAKAAPSFGGGARKTAEPADPGPGRPRLRAAYEASAKK